jgi:cation transport ATPase
MSLLNEIAFSSSVVALGNMREKGEEIRRRLPRLFMNIILGFIFWMMSVFIPPTLSEIAIPGIGTQASFLVWILMIIVMGIFLIRVLSDALVLGDIFTDVFVSKIGIKEERSPKRAAREVVYIIVIVLVVTAISPIVSTIQDYGFYLSTVLTYIGLGLIIVFIYDIGRILYTIIENKAEAIAEQLTKAQKKKKRG